MTAQAKGGSLSSRTGSRAAMRPRIMARSGFGRGGLREQRADLVSFEGLDLEQFLRQQANRFAVLFDECPRRVVAAHDHAADFFVHTLCRRFADPVRTVGLERVARIAISQRPK